MGAQGKIIDLARAEQTSRQMRCFENLKAVVNAYGLEGMTFAESIGVLNMLIVALCQQTLRTRTLPNGPDASTG